ncbi:hypothetical protein KKA72_01660 [Patescibacteria group bacterium]|nr:hypothetical protein [Patescibacteria group bacterium]
MLKIKNNLSILSVLAIISIFSFVLVVSAEAVQNQNTSQGQDQEQAQQQNQEQAPTQAQTQAQTQTQAQAQAQAQQGQINAEQHRSTVANSVQNILQIADREGGIGEQVRAIAQQQNQSVDTTVQAMEKVQTRSKIQTFFFGSDYKNLGTLRSEMVQTRNRLEQLNRLTEDIQNEGDKIELQNQVQALEQEQIKIESFVKNQENTFSLFGWLVRLFNR